MCGIAGLLGGDFSAECVRAELSAMAGALRHRGPDGEGLWTDATAGVALAHRRLSIIDLSPLGAQPMRSASGRYTITFNGEIYNFRDLRAQLASAGARFRGGSDTEVLLEAIEQWGLLRALERARGMFAFGLWDAAERALWLARDRFGEKPLYYGELGGAFVFASELKAFRALSFWRGEVDRDALALLLRHQVIPAPRSVFRGVSKLMPGCALRVRAAHRAFRVEARRYFEPEAIGAGAPSPPEPEAQLIERVSAALEQAVRLQQVADVPVGAFLSGGIDSSLIVAEMQRSSSQPVRTFSIGFEESEYDESPHARRVAEHLGTQHTELKVTARDALEVIPRLPSIYDEPFADSSQIPTAIVCALARREVTVALSGDGGDELFGGYPRYAETAQRWRTLQRRCALPLRFTAKAIAAMPRAALAPLSPVLRLTSRGRLRTPQRLKERARSWASESLPELYEAMTSTWQPAETAVLGASVLPPPLALPAGATDPHAYMMYADTCRYLPDDILVKVDRAAMAVSLETRVPLLDVEVARAAWRIPVAVHLKDGRGKWVLRQLLERRLPRELFERPKSGFAIPLSSWLRGELREWAASLLDPARLRREGYFRVAEVERRWRQHLRGQADWSWHLWPVLMFQSWSEQSSRPCLPVTPEPAVLGATRAAERLTA